MTTLSSSIRAITGGVEARNFRSLSTAFPHRENHVGKV